MGYIFRACAQALRTRPEELKIYCALVVLLCNPMGPRILQGVWNQLPNAGVCIHPYVAVWEGMLPAVTDLVCSSKSERESELPRSSMRAGWRDGA
jgi:hypothetical protein